MEMPYRKKYAKKTRRTYRPRRTAVKASTKAMYRIAKKVTLRQSEPKVASRLVSSLGTSANNLGHNVTKYYLNFLATEQGKTANPGTEIISNRIGNEIYAKGMKFRMQLTNQVGESNVSYKIWIFMYQSGTQLTDQLFYVGPSGSGGTQNRMLDFPDTRKVTILKHMVIHTSSRTANMNQQKNNEDGTNMAGRMHSTYRDVWVPINRKIRYEGNDSDVPKFRDMGMAILAYDTNNTSQGQVLGFSDFTSRLYFRDP